MDDAPEHDPLTPPFSAKIAVVVRDDLQTWQRLNVTAFLVSGITAAHPELVGAPYEDADGQRHLGLSRALVCTRDHTGRASVRH